MEARHSVFVVRHSDGERMDARRVLMPRAKPKAENRVSIADTGFVTVNRRQIT
ncbi:MAG: hypothetical protein IIA61_06165 [Candidatus Marinimicrobia bacterium]|nr:hypothetical protein [Candidatus Neomarinimicrobiota bacterium]